MLEHVERVIMFSLHYYGRLICMQPPLASQARHLLSTSDHDPMRFESRSEVDLHL